MVPSAALPSRSSINRVCTFWATAAPFPHADWRTILSSAGRTKCAAAPEHTPRHTSKIPDRLSSVQDQPGGISGPDGPGEVHQDPPAVLVDILTDQHRSI